MKTFALILFTTLQSLIAFAATYNVTNTTDGLAVNQLRGAILAADAAGGAHTINVAAGTYVLTLGQITFGNTAQNITIIGAGAATTIIEMTGPIASRDRIFFINPSGTTNSPVISISGITFQGGYLNSDPYGGAAICAGGGSAESLTVTNCIFLNNTLPANAYGGAAICMQVRGNLTIDNSTFTNNVSNDADGGAVLFIIFNSGLGTGFGALNVSNSTFTGNSVVFPGAGTSNGGAIAFTGQAGVLTFNANILYNTFINNTSDGLGGAISANNSPNLSIPPISFNRFVGNTATAGASSGALHFVESAGNVNADNNWWGCNSGPSAGPCDRAGGDVAGGGTLTLTKWLQLKTTASPNSICNTPAGLGNTSTVTASFLNNSEGTAYPPSVLQRLIGLPVTWSQTLGIEPLSSQQTTIQSNGTATATFTSNGTGGTATVNAQVDNIPANETSPARATITVNTIPTVTNPANKIVCAGDNISFTPTITGTPAPNIQWYNGATPLSNSAPYSGVNTATLTITNAQASDASANYNVRATNSCGTATSADASLTVNTASVAPTSISGITSICTPNSTTLTAEGGTLGTGANYQWGMGNVVGTSPLVGETNASITVSPGISTTYWVRIENACSGNTAGVTQLVTLNQSSVAPTGATGTTIICSGGNTTLTVDGGSKGTGANTQWFTGSCGGTPAGTGDAITVSPTTTTTYYVRYSGTCNTTTCAEVTVTVFNREINVQGNSTSIVDDDITPTVTDHTDFGNVIISNNLVRTYTIQNTGTDDLTVGAITVSGGDAALFTVGALSPATPIPGGGSATFTVTFAPTSTGLKTTTVTIVNNDCDEAPYNFTIQGTGTCVTDPVVINNNNSGPGSLRQAVIEACPGSTITFANSVTSPISLTDGQIIIDKNLTIQGPGANNLTVNNTAANSRVFQINSGITATISGLTITGGNNNDFGGGISNSGNLTVTNSTISGNSAGTGGGISNSGNLTVTNSTIFDNSAGIGGGISNNIGGTLTVTNSTISGNGVSFFGGGIHNINGNLTVTNSTISGNSAGQFGGGILSNTGTVNSKNTIIAGNSAGNVGQDFLGNVISLGYNLVGKTDFSAGWVASDLTGTNALPLNPLLGPLADNGGPTMTHALLPGSPAIDKGSVVAPPLLTDQRGQTRPVDNPSLANAVGGNGSDIGAFEVQCTPPVFTACPGNQSPVNNTPGLCSAVVNYTATASGTPAANYTYQFTGATTGSGSGTGSGSAFNVGVTNVTITATNDCGNPTCTFTVTVVDNQPPTINCPPAIQVFGCSIAAAPPAYATIFEWANAGGNGVENCTINNASFKLLSEVLTSSTACQKVYTRTYYVEDASGNSATCTQTVTIIDNTAPTGTNPTAITGVNSCTPTQAQADAAFNATLAATGYTDACGGAVTAELVSASVSGGNCGWTVTYTFRVKDVCSNYTTNQTYTRSGRDQTAPTGTNPSAITGVNSCKPTQAQANAGFDQTLAASGYTDACGGAVAAIIGTAAVVSGNNCGWTVTYNFAIRDVCGNYTSDQTYTRSGSDQTAPTGTNPTAITGINSCTPTQAQADAAFNATLAASGYTDACGGSVTAELVSAFVSGNNCGWTVTYTFRVKDVCSNYTTNQTYTRSGSDQTAPTGTNPTAITGVNSCTPTQAQANADFNATLAASGYTDACGGSVTAELVSAFVSGNNCGWTVTYTFRVKDVCGNYTSNQTYTRSGSDQTAPTGTNPTTITGVNSCTPTQAQANADFNATLAASGYTDACGGAVTAELVSAFVSGNNCGWTVTYTFRVKDVCGNYTSNQTYTRSGSDQTPPTITGETATPNSLWPPNHKMRDIAINYTAADNCGSVTTTLSVVSNEPDNGTGDGDMPNDIEILSNKLLRLRAERSGNGNGRIYTITITATDGCNTTTKTVTVVVAHNITGPVSGSSFKVGSTVNFAGTFWDKPGNRHTATWSIDGTSVTGSLIEPSGLRNGTVTGSYKFNSPGVYKLQMNVKDQTGVVSYANTQGDVDAIVVIYDPNGGYTYGGGWFASPAGSVRANSTATGKVSFGFNSNYFKNATNPKGETQMQFLVGDLEFNALNFEYLAISGAKAQYKGSGKLKGDQAGYSFIMTVIDGQLAGGGGTDKIRLKIFNKNTGAVIYDNQPGASDAADPTTVVGAGSTVVIVNTSGTQAPAKTTEQKVITEELFDAKVSPNPTPDQFVLQVRTSGKEPISIRVMDILGRKIKEMKVGPYQTVMFGNELIHGIYFVEILQGKNRKVIKLEKL